jgi:hypothetical protein
VEISKSTMPGDPFGSISLTTAREPLAPAGRRQLLPTAIVITICVPSEDAAAVEELHEPSKSRAAPHPRVGLDEGVNIARFAVNVRVEL